jgi:hypothetical protein
VKERRGEGGEGKSVGAKRGGRVKRGEEEEEERARADDGTRTHDLLHGKQML